MKQRESSMRTTRRNLSYSTMISWRQMVFGCFAGMLIMLSGCGGGGGSETPGAQGPGTGPSGSVNAALAWDPPANPDGSSVVGLSSYNVYYATSTPMTAMNSQVVGVDGQMTAVSLSLSPGTYYVAVTAVYTGGAESDPTDEVAAIIN